MLTSLQATHFRNLAKLSIEPVSGFNLIYGLNGSGKSSILETIHYLSLARSFRTHLTNPVISHQQSCTTIFGSVKDSNNLNMSIGIKKTTNESLEIHLNAEPIKSNLRLAQLLPLILINPDSYDLIHGGPSVKRQYLNWAMFHVEPAFISLWKNFQRCLKQRNMALKTGLPINEIQLWDKEFVELSYGLNNLYREYVEQLIPEFQSILSALTHLEGLEMEYYSGWNREKPLEKQLSEGVFKEKQQGYTLYGPHRADLKIYIKNVLAQEILSRGEQKLLIFAMHLAQASLLHKRAGIKVTYLVDDLAAEVDSVHRKKIIEFLSLNAQVFLTCLEREQLLVELPKDSLGVFHVERGEVKAF